MTPTSRKQTGGRKKAARPVYRVKFTAKLIESLAVPKSGRRQAFDAETDGLGIRLEKNASGSDRKIFFWWRRIGGTMNYRTIGCYPAVGCEEAKGQAEEWNGELAAAKRTNDFQALHRARGGVTFQELCERYIERRVRERASNPAVAEREIRYVMASHFKPWLPLRLHQITRDMVRQLHENITAEGHKTRADRIVQLARRLYNYAAKPDVELFAGQNPATKIELHGDNECERFLDAPEMLRLTEALKTEQHADLRDAVELALSAGLRKMNILAMPWKWWDEVNETITIPRPASKNKKPMVIPCTPKATEVLTRRAYLREQSEWVFPSEESASGHLIEIKRPFSELLKRARIENFTFHSLRRTFASWQSIAGVPLQQISKSLGHANLASAQVYARLNTEAVKNAMVQGAGMMEKAIRAARRKQKLLTVKTGVS